MFAVCTSTSPTPHLYFNWSKCQQYKVEMGRRTDTALLEGNDLVSAREPELYPHKENLVVRGKNPSKTRSVNPES